LQHELFLEHHRHRCPVARLDPACGVESLSRHVVELASLRQEVVGERVLGGALAGAASTRAAPMCAVAVHGAPPEAALTHHDPLCGSVSQRFVDLDSLRVGADGAGTGHESPPSPISSESAMSWTWPVRLALPGIDPAGEP